MLAANRRLREAGSDTPQLDSAVLMAHVLGVSKTWLYAHPNRPLKEREISEFEILVRRRMCHTPVAYLVGYKSFYGLDITVDDRVLIPRPETEQLVELAMGHLLAMVQEGQRPRVVDVGTGSGAIALALAVNVPEALVYAVDISDGALEVAAQNIWRYGVGEQVQLLPGTLLYPVPEPVDVVVANLPYVRTGDLPALPKQVRDYEPVLALDGGEDGLNLITELIAALGPGQPLRAKLCPKARVYLEIGIHQAPLVLGLVEQFLPGANVDTLMDYSGIDRVVIISF